MRLIQFVLLSPLFTAPAFASIAGSVATILGKQARNEEAPLLRSLSENSTRILSEVHRNDLRALTSKFDWAYLGTNGQREALFVNLVAANSTHTAEGALREIPTQLQIRLARPLTQVEEALLPDHLIGRILGLKYLPWDSETTSFLASATAQSQRAGARIEPILSQAGYGNGASLAIVETVEIIPQGRSGKLLITQYQMPIAEMDVDLVEQILSYLLNPQTVR